GRERGVVALPAEAIDGTVAAQQYALKAGERLAEIRRGYAVGKRFREMGVVVFMLLQPLDNVAERGAHLGWVFDGFQRLGFQRRLAAVPEKGGAVGAIKQRRRFAF